MQVPCKGQKHHYWFEHIVRDNFCEESFWGSQATQTCCQKKRDFVDLDSIMNFSVMVWADCMHWTNILVEFGQQNRIIYSSWFFESLLYSPRKGCSRVMIDCVCIKKNSDDLPTWSLYRVYPLNFIGMRKGEVASKFPILLMDGRAIKQSVHQFWIKTFQT